VWQQKQRQRERRKVPQPNPAEPYRRCWRPWGIRLLLRSYLQIRRWRDWTALLSNVLLLRAQLGIVQTRKFLPLLPLMLLR
jgi:hypothetical protein